MAILYKANETDFNHLGLGPLDDAVSILVTEERNGMFELEMSYPIEGTRINEIKLDRLIKADAGHNLKGQRFKIIRITKPIDGIVTINAEHVSYLTQDLALKPTVNYSGNASQALNTWKNSIVDINPFIVSSDIITNGNGSWSIKDVKNAREALGGVSGSILETYGGEYRFDNYSIRLMVQRGVNSGALIAYGRNLVDLTQEESIAETFTSIYPYAIYQDDSNKEVLLTLPEYFVDSEYVGNYARRKILPVDFSEDKIKDVATLRSRTNSYIKSNGIGIPKVNMQIKYIDLAKTLDYKDLAILEEVNLCDNVFIYFEQLGVNTSAKIIKTVWDDLLEQYDSIEVGEAKSSLSNSINATVDGKLETIVQRVNTIQLTADGLNVIYRGPEQPAPGNIGDLWYEPDGIYENMYQWDGSIWKLMLSTRDLGVLKQEVTEAIGQIEITKQSANDAVAKADQAIIDARFAQVDSNAAVINASNALTTASTAQINADTALLSAQTAVTNSGTALTNAQTALIRVGAVEDESGDLKTFYDSLTQTVGLKADKTTVNGINQTVTQQALDISANAAAVGLKADKTVVDTINSTVASHTLSIKATADSLATKAEKTLVDSINGTVASHTSQIKVNADGLALKADSSIVNTVKGTVDTHTTQIKATSDGLALKAESSLVNTINGTVNTHTGQIGANSTAINARLTSAQVDSLVAAKNYVNQTTLNATSIGLIAQITQVSTDLSNLDYDGKDLINRDTLNVGYLTSTGSVNADNGWRYTDFIPVTIGDRFLVSPTWLNMGISPSTVFYNSSKAFVRGIAGAEGRYEVTALETGFMRFSFMTSNLSTIKLQKGGAGFNSNLEKFTTLNATVDGIQTTVGTKASQTEVTQLAGQITTKVESSTYTSKMTQLDTAINLRVQSSQVTAAILADKTIKDTRNDNQLPSWYNSNYPKQIVFEFKVRSVMGVPGSATYGQLETKVAWNHTAGGTITQIFTSSDGVFQRTSNSVYTAWLAWDNVAETGKLISQINISTEGILLQGKRIQLDGDVTMTTAFVGKIKAIDIAADRITTGTLNAANVNLINLNVSKLVGDTSTFVKSAWNNSVGGGVTIDGGGIKTVSSDGYNAMLQNGVLYIKDPAGRGVGTVGGATTDASNTFSIDLINPNNFMIRETFSDGRKNEIFSFKAYLNKFSIQKDLEISENLVVKKDIFVNQRNIYDVSYLTLGIGQNTSNSIFVSSGGYQRYAAPTGFRWDMAGNQALVLARSGTTNYASMYAHLNMQGYNITNQSDRRLKTNIINTNRNVLDAMRKWNFVEYEWIDSTKPSGNQFGLIAQDTPELMTFEEHEDYYGIDSSTQIMLNSKASQELIIRTDEHKIKFIELGKKYEWLKQKIEKMESGL